MLEKITKDMIEALKNKDTIRLSTLRMLKSAVDFERINKRIILTDDDISVVISKQIKTRKESIEEFKKGNRYDLVEKTQKEIDILNEYMPEALSDDQINAIVDDAIKLLNASSIKDMGNVIREISPKLKGKADMSIVSNIIKNKLS